MSRPDRRAWTRTNKRARSYAGFGAATATQAVGSGVDWDYAPGMCFNKSAFFSAVDAEKKARRIVAEGGPAMRAYACPVCAHWHLSSRPLADDGRQASRAIRSVR